MKCRLCDERTGTGLFPHDRDYWRYPEMRPALMRVHYRYDCGHLVKERGYYYDPEYVERLRRDGEEDMSFEKEE